MNQTITIEDTATGEVTTLPLLSVEEFKAALARGTRMEATVYDEQTDSLVKLTWTEVK
jgi:hypothetical protein